MSTYITKSKAPAKAQNNVKQASKKKKNQNCFDTTYPTIPDTVIKMNISYKYKFSYLSYKTKRFFK